MPDLTFKSLMASIPRPQSPQPLWSGSFAGNVPADFLSPQDQAAALQRMLQQRGLTQIQTINPGQTWNGYDPNAFRPDDVMQSRMGVQAPENT